MIDIDAICSQLIDALHEVGYNDSTIFNYKGVIRRFKDFCSQRDVTAYTPGFGKLYADDVISQKSGKFSKNRYHTQGRFVRLIDSYFYTGNFDFSVIERGKTAPANPLHKEIYSDYQRFIRQEYTNNNTIHFYEYEVYYFLQYLNGLGIDCMSSIISDFLISYLQHSKPCRQRAILCGLRSFFKYLNRDDLLVSIAGIHAPRIRRIIPTLTEEENRSLEKTMSSSSITLRDAAIVLLGLSCGIRACDLIKLNLSDINWIDETISFRQSKTGNPVCLPLIPSVGNAIFRYINEERPTTRNNYLFVRELAPFDPFTDHSSCYEVVRRVFKQAGIEKGNRILGMHMLRHNSASVMIQNSVSIETIAAILGHSDPNTTEIYITTNANSLKECVLPMTGISTEVNS
jgi:integrase